MPLLLPEIEELLRERDFESVKDTLSELAVSDVAELVKSLPGDSKKTVFDVMDSKQRKALLDEFLPVDIVELFEVLPDDLRVSAFDLLETRKGYDVIANMEPEDAGAFLGLLPELKATQILNEIPPDERADLFGTLPEDQSKHFLELMETDEAKDVEQLVRYSPDTAGGIMTTQFAWIPGDVSTGDAIEFLRQQENDFDFYQAYVLSNEKLLGIVSLRELLISPPSTKVKKIINKVPSIPVTTDQEEVAHLIARYDIPSIPVVDRGKKMQGVIQVDDVVDVIEDESTEDMHRFGGATPLQRRYFDVSILGIVKSRLPWLVVLLFANFIAGFVIEQFSDTLSTMVSLAIFIPVLLACSGNAGMQVTSVVIRGLATEEIRFDQIWRVARRELSIGILMGVGLGVLVALRSLPIEGSLSFGLAVGLSMTAGIVIATTMGTLVPIVFDKLGFDPALVSAPLLTTIMDITSLLIYFSIAVKICHL